jgi:hypothetical protein
MDATETKRLEWPARKGWPVLLGQALDYIAQHRTGVIIMVAVMFLTLWLRNRR